VKSEEDDTKVRPPSPTEWRQKREETGRLVDKNRTIPKGEGGGRQEAALLRISQKDGNQTFACRTGGRRDEK